MPPRRILICIRKCLNIRNWHVLWNRRQGNGQSRRGLLDLVAACVIRIWDGHRLIHRIIPFRAPSDVQTEHLNQPPVAVGWSRQVGISVAADLCISFNYWFIVNGINSYFGNRTKYKRISQPISLIGQLPNKSTRIKLPHTCTKFKAFIPADVK